MGNRFDRIMDRFDDWMDRRIGTGLGLMAFVAALVIGGGIILTEILLTVFWLLGP